MKIIIQRIESRSKIENRDMMINEDVIKTRISKYLLRNPAIDLIIIGLNYPKNYHSN